MQAFISYAHDDDAHVERVRDFWLFLRAQGIDARLDLPAAERRRDWPEWMTARSGTPASAAAPAPGPLKILAAVAAPDETKTKNVPR